MAMFASFFFYILIVFICIWFRYHSRKFSVSRYIANILYIGCSPCYDSLIVGSLCLWFRYTQGKFLVSHILKLILYLLRSIDSCVVFCYIRSVSAFIFIFWKFLPYEIQIFLIHADIKPAEVWKKPLTVTLTVWWFNT